MIFKSKQNRVEIHSKRKTVIKKIHPFKELRKIFSKYKFIEIDDLPHFVGGAVGYFSYDICHLFEKLPETTLNDLNLPDIYLIFTDTILAFDHFENNIKIISNVFINNKNLKKLYNKGIKKIEKIEEKLRKLSCEEISNRKIENRKKYIKIKSNFSKEEFKKIVKICKEYIKAGDIFQANLSQRLVADFEGDSLFLYKVLKEINPSPFACYLDFKEFKIVSCSPERLLKVLGEYVETRPIAGTRPRGKTELEDKALAGELILNEKERAEHIMLLDLERNDLGKVCKYGTVKVNEKMVIEDYSHVFHIVSNVVGKLKKTKDVFDVIAACFPGGTITGCPKVRCMEIIDELENVNRGIYSGSIGYLSYSKNMDLNIVIRSFLIKDKKAYIQVGAGIVYDSIPEREYYETLYKAEALLNALKKATGIKIKGLRIKK